MGGLDTEGSQASPCTLHRSLPKVTEDSLKATKVTEDSLKATPRSRFSHCILPDLSLAFDTDHDSAWTILCCTGHPHLWLPAQACVRPATSQMPQTPQTQPAPNEFIIYYNTSYPATTTVAPPSTLSP